ncbi:MAG TPA: M20/M25/M40 family metallo-hydrolase [Thermoanaerobaculia bacterium]|nr:M20/M25/M40 family metallo-hydrolase [Thermoanaerobaculia bacterium]
MRRGLALVLPLAVVLFVWIWRLRGPAPMPADAPSRDFSAARAMDVSRELLREGVPHPVGSAANARVRDRIIARFRALGYRVDIQRRFACNAQNSCATTENILAGDFGRNSVVLTAHYDSVPAGPGASDDGDGVAALLEVARAIRGERFANPVAFLITDGEEAGLLGAEAFAADRTLLEKMGVAINVENRGTYGPSILFETSRNNDWLIAHASRALRHPFTTSVFYTVYDLLPNDTDVSVFKREQKAAVNFAAIRGVNWYHTPFDDLQHVSLRTLQHHGENVLAMARALGNAELASHLGQSARRDAVWFDLLGLSIVRWPAAWSVWIAIAALLALIVAARKTAPREITFGVVATFLALLVAAIGGFALAKLALLRSTGTPWLAHPQAAVAAMWLIGVASSAFAFALFRRRASDRALLLGTGIVWSVIGIALAVTLPGASYLFIAPVVTLAIALLATRNDTAVICIATTAAAIVFFPFGLVLYDALGGALLVSVPLVIAITATLAAPLLANRRVAVGAFIAAIVCAVISLALPAFTRERPRPISLGYLDKQWLATRQLPGFQPETFTYSAFGFASPAPDLHLPPVEVTATRAGGVLTLDVQSQRNADRLLIFFRPSSALRGVRINGVVPPPPPPRGRTWINDGWRYAIVRGSDHATLALITDGRVEIVAMDETYGLPPEGAQIANARNATPAFAAHDGDLTVTRAVLVK